MGCSPRIQQIVGKGKRGAAEYIKTCRSPEILNEILDRILSHEISINDSESIDWIRWLMAGGNTPENFTALVKKYNNASACGLVYSAQTVAYRCRTCSLSPCLSLCVDCFLNGQHEGHDYKMFRSDTGGACDCGNSSVMKSTGFCDKHSMTESTKNVVPPPDLLYIAELMAPRIFCRLILHLRNHHGELQIADNSDNYLTMLCEFSDMGAAMMRVLTSALTSVEVYRKLMQDWPRDGSAYASYVASSEKLYEKALESFENSEPPAEFQNCPGLQRRLQHKTFLEELVFWTVKYEFPQKLINFLLIMLPDSKYKETLTEAFVLHYSRIAMILERTANPDTLSKRVAKVSVQWFSNKELAVRMTEKLCLLQVMVVTLKNMISKILMPFSSAGVASSVGQYVINCNSLVISQYRYWLFVSDLNSVFSYRPVAMMFMTDDTLSRMWFSFLSYFQGMNMNQRIRDQHIEYEMDTDSVFLAELWATSYPVLPLLTHLTDRSTVAVTKKMLHNCLAALESWLRLISSENSQDERISFHLPLHRCLATFISQAVNIQQIPLTEILPCDDILQSMIIHPLRVQAVFYEIISGMWVRNGLQIKKQAMTYTQNDFCSSMVDIDIYLLQILSTKLPRDEFICTVIKEFHVSKWLRVDNEVQEDDNGDKNNFFVENFLQFMTTLCVNRTNLGNKPPQNIRAELVALLCVADRTHSQLVELMPERCGAGKSQEFDVILAEVADYKPPNFKYGGNMQQGLYTPKPCTWNEMYDPIHVLLRTGVNKKDFQCSANRFIDYVKRSKQLPSNSAPWPPFRFPGSCDNYVDPRQLLDCKTFHAFLWTVLYRYVHRNTVSEHVLSLAVYLLEMLLSIAKDRDHITQEITCPIDVIQCNLTSWFSSSQLSCNLRTVIRIIRYSSTSATPSRSNRNIEINESMISLLLKCHSKLSGFDDSFSTQAVDANSLDCRIGNGASFVGKVLTRIFLLDVKCRDAVILCCEKLSSKSRAVDMRKASGSRKQQCDKKRKAEERRRKIMESLAIQRDKFAKENKIILEDKMDWLNSEESEATNKVSLKKYYCSICRKMLPSTKENPMVMVTNIQATSILGHRKIFPGSKYLPSLLNERTFAKIIHNRYEILKHEFDEWMEAVDLSWESGVSVQTCGHSFDYQCLISQKKETYTCPVCRQRANCVLPVLPEEQKITIHRHETYSEAVTNLTKLVQGTYLQPKDTNCGVIENVVNGVLLDLKNCMKSNPPQSYDVPIETDSFLFLTSVIRTNLEIEILLRGGSLMKDTRQDVCPVAKKSCILPLFKLLNLRARTLNRSSVFLLWRHLSGDYSNSSLTGNRNRVPLLLRDPVIVFLQLVLVLPSEFLRAYYSWIVKFVYNLLIFQCATQLSYHMTELRRNTYRGMKADLNNNSKTFSLDRIMKFVIEILDHILPYSESKTSLKESDLDVEIEIQEMCLPFLRIASVLRNELFDEKLPEIPVQSEEFAHLIHYLELVPNNTQPSVINSSITIVLHSGKGNPVELWFNEYREYAISNHAIARNLIGSLHISWMQPKLIELPKQFNDVFQHYQRKPCCVCQLVCEKSSICLVCGDLVCLQGKCCERDGIYEAVRHSILCGAGTSIFLTVASSNVIIIRGPKACVWGSVYLDSYGEEDLDLKRGRPLYLSAERYNLLQHEWLSHSFNQGDESWILHKNQL